KVDSRDAKLACPRPCVESSAGSRKEETAVIDIRRPARLYASRTIAHQALLASTPHRPIAVRESDSHQLRSWHSLHRGDLRPPTPVQPEFPEVSGIATH